MKKVMITTAALALAFGLSPHAGAQTVDNGSAAASDNSKAVVKTDNSTDNHTKTITKNDTDTKTLTDSKNSGTAKNSGPFGAAANNYSTATTELTANLTNAYNHSKVVNMTTLDGYVSGNKISHIGNVGGAALAFKSGNGDRGGDGGYAEAKAHSGKAYSYGGDGGSAKANGGSATGGAGSTSNGTNGGTANGGTGSPANGGTNTGNTTNGATDWEAGNATGGNGGTATGGAGGTGGTATSGNATATANGGYGGNGGRGGDAYGGSAGTFNASNNLSGLTGAAGVTVAMQNTGMASLQQIGVTTMANVTVGR